MDQIWTAQVILDFRLLFSTGSADFTFISILAQLAELFVSADQMPETKKVVSEDFEI